MAVFLHTAVPSRRRVLGALTLVIALAAGAVVFGAKLRLIHAYGSDVPYMDEWDAEARELLIPRALHQLRPLDFIQPHNEHRVALTRVINYALTVANGQWDALLEMTFNAALHAGVCVALLLFARRLVAGVRFAAVSAVVLALFTLAFDWENTLEGFQSQFYLLEGCALALFWLCLPAAPLRWRWWLGWGVGLIGLGTMSSGFLAPVTMLAMLVLQAGMARAWSRRETLVAGAFLLLGVAGLLMITHVPGHDRFKAHSAVEWLEAMATGLSWPTLGWPVAFLVLQAPMVALIANRVRRRWLPAYEAVLVALTVWSWLQVTALSYGRANFGMLTSPRYMDMYAVESVTNALALVRLWPKGPGRAVWWGVAAAWTGLFVLGVQKETQRAYRNFLDDFPRLKAAEQSHLRAFLTADDSTALQRVPPEELPYPNPGILKQLLDGAGLRSLLPLSIRPPLPLAPDTGSSGFSQATSDLPPGPSRRMWIAQRGPARFFSQPMSVGDFPLLHLEVSGSSDLEGTVVRLESPDHSESSTPVSLLAGRWQAADLCVPGHPTVRLVVDVPPGPHWLALTEPVELGGGSWVTHWLLHRADLVEEISGGILVAAWAALLTLGWRSEADPDAAACAVAA